MEQRESGELTFNRLTVACNASGVGSKYVLGLSSTKTVRFYLLTWKHGDDGVESSMHLVGHYCERGERDRCIY